MASQIPQNALSNPTNMATANQTLPKEGPQCIPLGPFNFGTQASYAIDLTVFQQLGKISVVQTVFIDNAANSSNMVVTATQSGQSITCPPLSQGYFPLLAVNPIKFVVSSAGAGNNASSIYAINVPIAPQVWSGLSGASSLLTQPVSDAILDATVSGGRVKTLDTPANATPAGFQQLAPTVSTALTVPGASTRAIMQAEVQNIRWRDDGVAPTSTVGMLIKTTDQPFLYTGNLAAFLAINVTAGGLLDISYYTP